MSWRGAAACSLHINAYNEENSLFLHLRHSVHLSSAIDDLFGNTELSPSAASYI